MLLDVRSLIDFQMSFGIQLTTALARAILLMTMIFIISTTEVLIRMAYAVFSLLLFPFTVNTPLCADFLLMGTRPEISESTGRYKDQQVQGITDTESNGEPDPGSTSQPFPTHRYVEPETSSSSTAYNYESTADIAQDIRERAGSLYSTVSFLFDIADIISAAGTLGDELMSISPNIGDSNIHINRTSEPHFDAEPPWSTDNERFINDSPEDTGDITLHRAKLTNLPASLTQTPTYSW